MCLFLIGSVIFAFFVSNVAKVKWYCFSSRFIAGLFFDVLALLAVAGLPNQRLSRYVKYIAEKQGITNADLNTIHVQYKD